MKSWFLEQMPFMVDIQDDTQTIIESILKQNFSRIPVYDGDKDNVIGLIHTKNLLKAGFTDGFDNIVLRRLFTGTSLCTGNYFLWMIC